MGDPVKRIRGKTFAGAAAATLAAVAATAGVAPSASAVGIDTTFIVLAPEGASTAQAAARATAADGTVVAEYPQIGVLVVRSDNARFVDRRRRCRRGIGRVDHRPGHRPGR